MSRGLAERREHDAMAQRRGAAARSSWHGHFETKRVPEGVWIKIARAVQYMTCIPAGEIEQLLDRLQLRLHLLIAFRGRAGWTWSPPPRRQA